MLLGHHSSTRFKSDESFLEGVVKLFPAYGAAVLIQAIVLHVSLIRAIWTGRFPNKRSHEFRLTWTSNCYATPSRDSRHLLGFYVSAVCAFFANHSLWLALHRAREAAEQTKSLGAASAAEKGDTSAAECAARKGHTLTAEFAVDNNRRHPSMQLCLTTALMLVLSLASFYDLATAFHSGTIDAALSVFGPCFLVALIIAALMLHGALSVPRLLHGSNRQYLVSVYREGGLVVFPCTCMALGFAMWYHKGLPLNPGVYAAGHWATALYVGVGEVLEQSLSSS